MKETSAYPSFSLDGISSLLKAFNSQMKEIWPLLDPS